MKPSELLDKTGLWFWAGVKNENCAIVVKVEKSGFYETGSPVFNLHHDDGSWTVHAGDDIELEEVSDTEDLERKLKDLERRLAIRRGE